MYTNQSRNETKFKYDSNGNLVEEKDIDGSLTKYSYNKNDIVSSVIYDDGKRANLEYDKESRLVKVTDWLGETSFALDPLGRLLESNDHRGDVADKKNKTI